MLCALLESILLEPDAIEPTGDISKVKALVTQAFVFSYTWAIGGNVIDSSREPFESFVQETFKTNQNLK